jgi:hypothetical protein
MGIFSSLFCRKQKVTIPSTMYDDFVVDLTGFKCGKTKLGDALSPCEFYSEFINDDVFRDEANGVEIGIKNKSLDYILLELERYPGKFSYKGNSVHFGKDTTISDVLSIFGEPYWHDDDSEESILFYEDGIIELQFEFPGKTRLGFITIMVDPIMAKREQREAYGVTKDWPPK